MFEIYKKEGLSIPELMEIFELSRATAQRDIKILKDSNMVAFVGAKKTGKYLLTNKLLKKIKE